MRNLFSDELIQVYGGGIVPPKKCEDHKGKDYSRSKDFCEKHVSKESKHSKRYECKVS